jgi:hypothetical protein
MAISFAAGVLGRAGFTYACSKNLRAMGLVYNGVDMAVCALASRSFLDRYQNGSNEQKLPPFHFTMGLVVTRFLGMAAGITATAFLCQRRMGLGNAMSINFGGGLLMLAILVKKQYQTGAVKFPTLY